MEMEMEMEMGMGMGMVMSMNGSWRAMTVPVDFNEGPDQHA